jgi:hypothetical protein
MRLCLRELRDIGYLWDGKAAPVALKQTIHTEVELTLEQRVKLMEKLTEQLTELVESLAEDREKAEDALEALLELRRTLDTEKRAQLRSPRT